MLGKERILFLLNRLEQDNIINVKDIAKELQISEATIRRDLTELEKQGKIKRVHGGAILADANQIISEQREVQMKERFRIHYEEKNMLPPMPVTLSKMVSVSFLMAEQVLFQ